MTYNIRTNIPPGATSGPELADITEEIGDLTQIVVESDTSNQPSSPSEGDAYIVNGDASWGGSQYDVAVFRDSTWIYHTPEEGWVAYIKDRSEARRFNGTDWNSRLPDSSPEHATDSGTDVYVSATNTDVPKAGDKITRDFQSANTTTTPTLDSLTITTRDGSALWAGALSGVHELQLNAGGTAWLVLDPNPVSANSANAGVQRDANGRAKFADPSAAQDVVTKNHFDTSPQVAKGWVVFDGTAGTISIADSHNVSSLTDNGTGTYSVNWSTAFSSGNYAVSGSGAVAGDHPYFFVGGSAPSAGSVQISFDDGAGTLIDPTYATCMAFGDLA